MKRKILVYSPYSQAMPHVLHEATIAKSLQLRGAEVVYLCCNSVFDDCDAHWERWSARTEESCRHCMATAAERLERYGLPHEMLGQYLTAADFVSIREWCEHIAVNDLRGSSFKGYPVGEYGLSSLCSHYRLGTLDLSAPKVVATYRNYIMGCALAVEAFSRMFAAHTPDSILMFNGRFFSHNILLHMARNKKISVYIHERGWVDDTIRVKLNENVLSSDVFRNTWKAWEPIPLSLDELKSIDQIFMQRKAGKNTNWFSFVYAAHDIDKIYEILHISPEATIISLFTSSTDEFIGAPEFKIIIDQMELINRAISFFSKKADHCLVIRVHPNTFEDDVLVHELKLWKDSFPSNVKLILPKEVINSYQLLEVSAACIVYMSTIGLEAASMGKPVLMCGKSIFYGQDYSLNLPNSEACESFFERLLSEKGSAIERMRSAYRYGYHLYYRTCIPFPLVETTEVFKSRVTYASPDLLVRGFDSYLDQICDAILENRSVDAVPDASYSSSCRDEDDFFAEKLLLRPVTGPRGGVASEPARILFVCHNLPPHEYSGTPIITHAQARTMLRLGKEVAILIPSHEASTTFSEKRGEDGLIVFTIPKIDRRWSFFEESQNAAATGKHVAMVAEILRKFQPDVIHINDYVDMPLMIFEAFASSNAVIVREVWNDEEICFRVSPIIKETRQVCSGPDSFRKCGDCHRMTDSSGVPDLEQKLEAHRRYVDHLYSEVVDGVVFASSMFGDHFTRYVQIPSDRTATIACGMARPTQASTAFPAAQGEKTTFTFMGNFFEFRKGLDVLLRACVMLGPSSGIRVQLFGCGSKNDLAEIERVSTLTGGMVTYKGRYSSDDLPGILGSTDVGIITSYFESYCMVLREFLSSGIPVLATDFCGSEIVSEGRNGFLVGRGDAAALAEKMEKVAADSHLLCNLSAGAQATEIPSVLDEAQALLAFYGRLASQPKVRLEHLASYPPRLIAFHLPQFHTTPENDEWWGKGFTEWTNVRKAQPLFDGHYQPHVPADLGYYDLSEPSAMKAQAELAREYGIHGFCFYHYWFNGKLLLETPLHQMLKSGEPDFPFCLCWANEDWTRAWDGKSGEVLIGQNYSDADDIRHFLYLLNFFEDKRYIRVNGKPLFLVYRANRMPNPLETTTVWRNIARKAGLGELYLCRVESSSEERLDPSLIGFDAAVEFQPDWKCLPPALQGEQYGKQRVYSYEEFKNNALYKPEPAYVRHPCVLVSWDNSPRRQNSVAQIFVGSAPQLYQAWLQETVNRVATSNRNEKLVFINAWNEWGEGNHLEPDMKHGSAYLEATKAALSAVTTQNLPSISIKCSTPSRTHYWWGDTYFAEALARALKSLGYQCRVDCRDEWYTASETDVVISLRGLYCYIPSRSSHNIIWIISHPELITTDELNAYDYAFCASQPFIKTAADTCRTPMHYLPQAADLDMCNVVKHTTKDIDILFVGNNYEDKHGKCRKIIEDLLKTGKKYNFAIVGRRWSGYVKDSHILTEFVHPNELSKLHARAKIVLNSHHEEMQRFGFINNRTFDLALSKVFQISDYVEGMEELSVITYSSVEDLQDKIDFYLLNDSAREFITDKVYEKCLEYTFDNCAKNIVGHLVREKVIKIGGAVEAKKSGVDESNSAGLPHRMSCLQQALQTKGWFRKFRLYAEYFGELSTLRSAVRSPVISIIVISWRHHPDTLTSFKILERQRHINFELIFVNNGAQSGEFDELLPFVDTYVRLNKNTGAYLARNVGAVFAKAPLLFFLEDDGIPEENIVEAHVAAQQKYDVIAVRGVYRPKTENRVNTLAHHYYLGPKPFPLAGNLEGNISYSADVFYQVGGWDDEITFGHGGYELALRLSKAVPDLRKQIYSPDPIIYHDYAQNEQHLDHKIRKQEGSLVRLKLKYPEWDQFVASFYPYIGRTEKLLPQKHTFSADLLNNLIEQCNYSQAIEYLMGMLRIYPDTPEILIELCKLYRIIQDDTNAFAQLSKLMQMEPENLTIKRMYGEMLALSGRFAEAIDQFESVLRAHNHDYVTLWITAIVCKAYGLNDSYNIFYNQYQEKSKSIECEREITWLKKYYLCRLPHDETISNFEKTDE